DGAVSGVGLMIDSGGTAIVGSGAPKPGIPSSPGGVSVDVIGFTGAGALHVVARGGVDDTGLVLGDRATGSGTLTIDGSGSAVIVIPAAAPNGMLIIGNAGTGVVTVQNGGVDRHGDAGPRRVVRRFAHDRPGRHGQRGRAGWWRPDHHQYEDRRRRHRRDYHGERWIVSRPRGHRTGRKDGVERHGDA